ncbi:MAG: PD-(D/E)XK nuclease family protein [Candidatus Brocadiia bacterium]
MPSATIATARTYPALEEQFSADLAAVPDLGDRRVWVLVPTNMLALHLRRRAARRLGGLAGVDFLILKDAARRLALASLAAAGQRPVPSGAEELVAQRLLAEEPAESSFHEFREFPNAGVAVLRAVRTLTDALWTPRALRSAAGQRRLADLAGLWDRLVAWKRERGYYSVHELIAQAARSEPVPEQEPDTLFVYGFYDLTESQRALVARLARQTERTCAYLLWDGDEEGSRAGFGYAEPTLRWLEDLLGTPAQPIATEPASPSDLRRAVDGLFREHPLLEEEPTRAALAEASADGTVRVLSCPGREPEAREVAREVLRTAEGDRPGVAVLMRRAEPTAALLEEQFERAGVRWFTRQGLPLGRAPTARVALALLDIAAGRTRRADVVDFFALADMDWPEGLSAVAMDRLTREAGVAGQRQDWAGLLRAHAGALATGAEHADDEAEAAARRRDAELCQLAAGVAQEFFERLTLDRRHSWAQAGAALHRLVEDYAPSEDPDRQAVLAVIAGLEALDVTDTPPRPGRVRWLLARLLDERSRRRGRFQRSGVTAATLMAARGVTFGMVVAPGLVEKEFPARISEQPILTDADRQQLNSVAGEHGCGALPLQRRRPLEERYLMRIAVGSARQAVLLTYPRLDLDKGRPRMPSRFLGEVCSALAGVSVSAGHLGQDWPAPWWERVPLNRPSRRALEAPLDGREYDRLHFEGPEGYRPGYCSGLSQWFARALRMERERWQRRCFGPYDGRIMDEDLLEGLRSLGTFERPVSPTRLETYARCPFSYFMRYVLAVAEPEESAEEFLPTPRQRGSWMHEVLRDLYAENLKGRPLGDLADEDATELLRRAGRLLDRAAGPYADSRAAVWQPEREAMLAQVRRFLDHERQEHPGAVPDRFEYGFEGVRIEELGGEPPFRGRVDRTDRLPDGALRVMDYKTGSSRGYAADSLAGGTQLQLPIYLLCAAQELGAAEGDALYAFLRGPREVRGFSLGELQERIGSLRNALSLIRAGVAAGRFFPLPRKECPPFCPYQEVCGAARDALREIKAEDPALAELTQLREIE